MLELPGGSDAGTGLREVMRVFPQGVTVVTWTASDGPKGITVSAFTSISLDPPLILVSISKKSSLHDAFIESKSFAVNFLADDQRSVSDRFAGRHDVGNRFHGIKFETGLAGSPVIQGARALIECNLWRIHDGGDHSLVLGRVIEARKLNDKLPLVFYGQQYTSTERIEHLGPPLDTMW